MTLRTLSELEQAVGADPDSPALRHLLGAHYAQIGRYEEAEREFYRAISLDPQAHLSYTILLAVPRIEVFELQQHETTGTGGDFLEGHKRRAADCANHIRMNRCKGGQALHLG